MSIQREAIFKKGKKDGPDDEEEASLLMGDAINNFKTIQSFGYEDLIVQHYKDLLKDSV
jgi:hypothetical protein